MHILPYIIKKPSASQVWTFPTAQIASRAPLGNANGPNASARDWTRSQKLSPNIMRWYGDPNLVEERAIIIIISADPMQERDAETIWTPKRWALNLLVNWRLALEAVSKNVFETMMLGCRCCVSFKIFLCNWLWHSVVGYCQHGNLLLLVLLYHFCVSDYVKSVWSTLQCYVEDTSHLAIYLHLNLYNKPSDMKIHPKVRTVSPARITENADAFDKFK